MLLDLLFPRLCLLCLARTREDSHLCETCESELPILPEGCQNCADTLTRSGPLCSECKENPPPFDKTLACFAYEGPIPKLIAGFKFEARFTHARFLEWALLKKLSSRPDPRPTRLIPLPLHPNRLKNRGFNQTHLLAKPLARKLHLPLDIQSLIRLKDTLPQSGLSRPERGMNIANAFSATKPLTGEHIALLDDVMTTGQTLKTAAATLKAAGAKTVTIWCIARRTRAKVAE